MRADGLAESFPHRKTSLQVAMPLDLDVVTPVRYEVSTPATNDWNVGENEVTFVEERPTSDPNLSSFKARKTRSIPAVALHVNDVIDVDDDDDNRWDVAASALSMESPVSLWHAHRFDVGKFAIEARLIFWLYILSMILSNTLFLFNIVHLFTHHFLSTVTFSNKLPQSWGPTRLISWKPVLKF